MTVARVIFFRDSPPWKTAAPLPHPSLPHSLVAGFGASLFNCTVRPPPGLSSGFSLAFSSVFSSLSSYLLFNLLVERVLGAITTGSCAFLSSGVCVHGARERGGRGEEGGEKGERKEQKRKGKKEKGEKSIRGG